MVLRDGDRDELAALVRSKTVRADVARRARMMLLAADGESNTQIAHTVGVSRPTVTLWRSRYEQAGIAGLVDEHRSGRPRSVDHAKVVAATLAPPPKKYGVTHWSSRLLGNHLGIDNTTVAAVRTNLTELRLLGRGDRDATWCHKRPIRDCKTSAT